MFGQVNKYPCIIDDFHTHLADRREESPWHALVPFLAEVATGGAQEKQKLRSRQEEHFAETHQDPGPMLLSL